MSDCSSWSISVRAATSYQLLPANRSRTGSHMHVTERTHSIAKRGESTAFLCIVAFESCSCGQCWKSSAGHADILPSLTSPMLANDLLTNKNFEPPPIFLWTVRLDFPFAHGQQDDHPLVRVDGRYKPLLLWKCLPHYLRACKIKCTSDSLASPMSGPWNRVITVSTAAPL